MFELLVYMMLEAGLAVTDGPFENPDFPNQGVLA